MRKARIFTGAALALVVAGGLFVWQLVQTETADPSNVSLVSEGETVYQHFCANCHGSRLEGLSPIGGPANQTNDFPHRRMT